MFDLDALRAAVAAHGAVARVVIAAHDGSAPRETGAAMLVWEGGQAGTIGGGALEWEAAARARAMLRGSRDEARPTGSGAVMERLALGPTLGGSRAEARPTEGFGGARVERLALGPALGQCCGGAVTLLTEVFDARTLPVAEAGVVARAVAVRSGQAQAMPLAVGRILDRARGQGVLPAPTLVQGWFVEPVARPLRTMWIWGAGHVGRALVGVMAPLPGVAITWLDVAADRFPAAVPPGVSVVAACDLGEEVGRAPADAAHLVLTYSHALDLDLCHRLLQRGFGSAGLIGSATKWARFRSRLAALGHAPAQIARIRCPIGDPALGKHPQAIAVGVAADILRAGGALRDEARA